MPAPRWSRPVSRVADKSALGRLASAGRGRGSHLESIRVYLHAPSTTPTHPLTRSPPPSNRTSPLIGPENHTAARHRREA
ncbi:hypothetical protein HPB47_002522 [Ixodes persulcatus]|uniref:Uncharacterized protein n=1 Tax=Ixodes persulcatus TaxID=34615 RepID=A0AC60PMK3_IXOPE|nr:hypothetical protein HPB47_002522 [Ixodes persulcatus]